jgi:hypothetical protein
MSIKPTIQGPDTVQAVIPGVPGKIDREMARRAKHQTVSKCAVYRNVLIDWYSGIHVRPSRLETQKMTSRKFTAPVRLAAKAGAKAGGHK